MFRLFLQRRNGRYFVDAAEASFSLVAVSADIERKVLRVPRRNGCHLHVRVYVYVCAYMCINIVIYMYMYIFTHMHT